LEAILFEAHTRSRRRLDELRPADVRLAGSIVRGEQRLMLAVLENAILAYQKHVFSTSRRGRKLFRETESWILSDDRCSPFAFESICDALDLHPGYVRTGILSWRERQCQRAVLHSSQDRIDGGGSGTVVGLRVDARRPPEARAGA
jgi:hypothetical protein